MKKIDFSAEELTVVLKKVNHRLAEKQYSYIDNVFVYRSEEFGDWYVTIYYGVD